MVTGSPPPPPLGHLGSVLPPTQGSARSDVLIVPLRSFLLLWFSVEMRINGGDSGFFLGSVLGKLSVSSNWR